MLGDCYCSCAHNLIDPRPVLLWPASQVLNLRLNSKIDYIFHLLQAYQHIYLFIFLFPGPTSTDNTYVTLFKAFCMVTRAFQSGFCWFIYVISISPFEAGPWIGPGGGVLKLGLGYRRNQNLRRSNRRNRRNSSARKSVEGQNSKSVEQAKCFSQTEILSYTLG